ncbi:transposase domain-containing protein [Microbacterium sp. W4I4]|uniref:transposase domain-containing protein n=1 Tax=Microbacterium sp. W4I4 TaxID=3042295 RepID=UPI00358EF7B2
MPRSGWKVSASDRWLSNTVPIGLFTRVSPADVVEEVIATVGRAQVRHRSLPARFIV